MTTPAPATATAAAPKSSDADMIEAMFRAFSHLVPGAHARSLEGRLQLADTFSQLSHYGAADSDLAVIRDWLGARQE